MTAGDPELSRPDWRPESPLLLTRAQAAQLCQVSEEILDQWSYEPGFPVIRRNGGHFVRIHRGTVANIGFVQELFPDVDGGVLVRLKDERKTELSVARDRVRDLKIRLGI